MTSAQIDHERWLSGMPRRPRGRWWQRMVRSPLFWLTVVLVPFYVFAIVNQYLLLHPDREFDDGTVALGLNHESLRFAAYWAMWTALAWSVAFMWLDRYRPQKALVWLLTFLWGACASTFFSIYINTWAGQAMNTTSANSDMGERAAIFIAPFSEEATKATVLFLLVILYRARIVTRMGIVTLAGLSAVGFAFVENIIYYARSYVYVANTIGLGTPREEVMELVMLRGVYTSFAHPLFTMMIAFGIAVALGARSKIVRVMAPLAGFIVGAGGHMLFNGIASTMETSAARRPWFFALGLVVLMIIFMLLGLLSHGQLIKRRLLDYRRHGWLQERDPVVFSSLTRRFKLNLAALLRGPRMWWRTRRFMARMTELAYVRNSLTRGTVADGGLDRAHELLLEIEDLRPQVLSDSAAQKVIPPRKRSTTPPQQLVAPPQSPGPAGLAGQWPRP